MANAGESSAPTILIVGSGLGGLYCARRLEALMRGHPAKIVVVSPLDHAVYVSLLPEVSTGVIEPRHLAVSLHRTLRRSRIILGEVIGLDIDAKTASVNRLGDAPMTITWDRLILAPGAAVAAPAVPGLADYAIGFKTLAQAAYLRDHVLRQLTTADANEAERAIRCTFVVIGGGYTGTEVAGQMQWFTHKALARFPNLRPRDVHWVLVEAKPQLMSQLGSHLGTAALA